MNKGEDDEMNMEEEAEERRKHKKRKSMRVKMFQLKNAKNKSFQMKWTRAK